MLYSEEIFFFKLLISSMIFMQCDERDKAHTLDNRANYSKLNSWEHSNF